MKRIITILSAAVLLTLLSPTVYAQWKVGVNAGAAYNHYSIDKQYMTDYHFEGAWGASMGIISQYNFTDWLGLRGELNFTQRNYRHERNVYYDRLKYHYRNDYLLLPVAANFSFGGRSLRGFMSLGVYGGYWLNSHRSGKDFASLGEREFIVSEDLAFSPEKDQRWDFGYTAGVGVEWRFVAHWAVQAEALGYYSVVSSTKQYMTHVKDFRYNTTVGLQAGVLYLF